MMKQEFREVRKATQPVQVQLAFLFLKFIDSPGGGAVKKKRSELLKLSVSFSRLKHSDISLSPDTLFKNTKCCLGRVLEHST